MLRKLPCQTTPTFNPFSSLKYSFRNQFLRLRREGKVLPKGTEVIVVLNASGKLISGQ